MATTLAQKLNIKAGQRMVVLNPPEGYFELLSQSMPEIDLEREFSGSPKAVLVFANTLQQALELAPPAFKAAEKDGLLWIAYPKGTSGVKTDINRDRLWEAMQPIGYHPVRMVALDEIWSVMRFRPLEEADN